MPIPTSVCCVLKAFPISLPRANFEQKKPGEGFGFGPVNTLSDNSRSARTPPSRVSRALLDGPPAKRQRISAETSTVHTTATFETIDSTSDGLSDRRSVTETTRSQSGSHLHSHGISEFQVVHDERKRTRRRKAGPALQSPSINTNKSATKSSDDEMGTESALIRPNQNLLFGQATPEAQKYLMSSHIRDAADLRFDPKTKNLKSKQKQERRRIHQLRLSGSDDETDPLHSDPPHRDPFHKDDKMGKKDISASPISQSLSSRGDLQPTWPKPRAKALAKTSISFPIKSALCEPSYILQPKEGEEHEGHCVLVPCSDGDVAGFTPQFLDETEGGAFGWLKIDASKISQVYSHPESRFIKITRSQDLARHLGKTLMLECFDKEAASRLVSCLPRHQLDKVESRYAILNGPSQGPPLTDPCSPGRMQQVWERLLQEISKQIKNAPVAPASDEKKEQPAATVTTAPKETPPERDELSWSKNLRSGPREGRTYATRQASSNRRERSPSFGKMASEMALPLPRWTEQNPGWEEKWKMPLMFLRTTVEKDDIPKLDEGECLNDNIITFGLRYLSDKFESRHKDLKSRVFFHNSFFYEKLKMPGKGMNYDGVKNWTSKVDILACDYIVVPVNEHHHWWVAIICNPGNLDPDAATRIASAGSLDTNRDSVQADGATKRDQDHLEVDGQGEDVEMTDAPSDSPRGAPAAGIGSLSIGSPGETTGHMVNPYPTDHQGQVIDLVGDETAGHERTPSADKETKQRPGGRKLDPRAPRAITLDSLGQSHYSSSTLLKRYLVKEFEDKRGIHIKEVSGPFGMTATNIPQQDNFCDCGVYLLGYMQEFVKDPDLFVNSLLLKEERTWDWTAPELRDRWRDIIQDHQEAYQAQQIKDKKARAAAKRLRHTSEVPTPSKPAPLPKSVLESHSLPPGDQASLTPGVDQSAPASAEASRASSPTAQSVPSLEQRRPAAYVPSLNIAADHEESRFMVMESIESPTLDSALSPPQISSDLVRPRRGDIRQPDPISTSPEPSWRPRSGGAEHPRPPSDARLAPRSSQTNDYRSGRLSHYFSSLPRKQGRQEAKDPKPLEDSLNLPKREVPSGRHSRSPNDRIFESPTFLSKLSSSPTNRDSPNRRSTLVVELQQRSVLNGIAHGLPAISDDDVEMSVEPEASHNHGLRSAGASRDSAYEIQETPEREPLPKPRSSARVGDISPHSFGSTRVPTVSRAKLIPNATQTKPREHIDLTVEDDL